MSALATDRRRTLELVEPVSLAGSGAVTPPVFLERLCVAVSAAFEFDDVTAVRFHPDAAEVSEVVVDATLAQRRPVDGIPRQ
jgi:hypothetical protein